MSLFTDPDALVAEIKQDRLLTIGRQFWPGVVLSDRYILGQVKVAEREIESSLRCFLEPVEVLPTGATQAERDAFDAVRWVEEPGYDLDPEIWRVNNFGWTNLRHAPVITVHSVRFVYPRPANTVWDVPADWIRLDKKPGYLRFYPTGGSSIAPLAGYLGPMMMGGAIIPQAIQVRYQSGLKDCANDYPQILDMIKKKAVLLMIEDQFLPQSGSQSIDGMSQSFSQDAQKHSELLQERVDRQRERLKGIMVR